MKNENNIQVANVQSQSVAQHFLDFFANFSLALLIKVLLIKENVYVFEKHLNQLIQKASAS